MAFKAVWALEQKRRDNDRRILALHQQMCDMMSVLTQCVHSAFNLAYFLIFLRLKNVKDTDEVAPDGSTIKGRMQGLVKGTADDIKACANGRQFVVLKCTTEPLCPSVRHVFKEKISSQGLKGSNLGGKACEVCRNL
jgi:hypothetical protein